jgi:4-hydroxy-tetrahydrodipicolinate synthase
MSNNADTLKPFDWSGVMPAITTPFTDGDAIDHGFLATHATWMVDAGSTAIIALGSLGEGATLEADEKIALLETLVGAVGSRVPVVAAISSLSTAGATTLAKRAAAAGCRGLMVLPPYVHKGPWAEIRAHFAAVIEATDLSCMLYNNPIAYGTDLGAAEIAELAGAHANVHAVKESSGDVRRVTAARERLGNRLSYCAGLDDMIVEACGVGARGWVAGLVNAFPHESIALFEAARDGERERAFELYRWFLPLLRLDTVPEFVQLIKLVQARVGAGSERVRLPRLPVEGALRAGALEVIEAALSTRDRLGVDATESPS